MRRNKKIYAAHPSIAFAAIGYGRDMLAEKILGQFVESAFAANFFWRDRQKNEVDVVLENKVLFPIEVKFQTRITSSDLKGLCKFIEEFSLKKGMLVTRHLFEKRNIDGKDILFVPAWLLMCVY